MLHTAYYIQLQYIVWHIDQLLGKHRETNNETTAVARQRPARNSGCTAGSGVFCVVRSEAISHDRPSSCSECSGVERVRW
jgi:hypothetical protein